MLPEESIFPSFFYTFDNEDPTDELYRYVTTFKIDIKAYHAYNYEDDSKDKIELAGKAIFRIVHGGSALNNGISLLEIMDVERDLIGNYGSVYDEESYDFAPALEDFYGHDFDGLSLGIIERMEILPAYRGLGFGKLLIQDLYHRFGCGMGLFVLKVFPLQLESGIKDKKCRTEWDNKMEYDTLEQDYEKAHYTLLAYYQGLGFDTIKEFIKDHNEDDTLVFLNPVMRHDALAYEKAPKIIFKEKK